jgi:hypothetical protein
MSFENAKRGLLALGAVSCLLLAHAGGCAAPEEDPAPPIVTEAISHTELGVVPAGGDLGAAAAGYLGSVAAELGLSAAGDFLTFEVAPGFEGVRRAAGQQVYEGLPVVGSTLHVWADAGGLASFSGTVTRNLDGFAIEPSIGADEAAAIALEDRIRFAPVDATVADEVVGVELVILPRTGGTGADLAWQVELRFAATEPGALEGWRTFVDAGTGAVLSILPASGGCSFWDKLKCQLLPNPAKAACLAIVCGGPESVCGDGSCDGDEDDVNCARDCGCAATDACDPVAPYGCWCDSGCAADGDCCVDASICYLPPDDGGDDGTCEWGERSTGYLDRAKLTFYRMKYYAIAEAGGLLKDAPEARDLLLHYLGNSGTDRTIDVNDMLADCPSFQQKADADRKRFGEEASMQAKAAGATGTVTSAIPDEELSHSIEQAESYNWWAAIHRFEYKHVGEIKVTKVGETWEYTVESTIVLRDKYDWDRDAAPAGPGGAFNQRELDDMNCFGWAKEFWVNGMSLKQETMGVWQ